MAVLTLLSLAACGSQAAPTEEPAVSTEPSLQETVEFLERNFDRFTIDGSTSMIPLHQALRYRFSAKQDTVTHSQTVDAFERMLRGEADILLSVDYSDELLEKAQSGGARLVQRAVTREAFVFLINRHNPVRSLTTEQIKDIYSGRITNWREVGGDDFPIRAFQRNQDSGSQIRMVKFMDGDALMDTDVEYLSLMGSVIEQIGSYDQGFYSIAYNMYTFTEKQYPSETVSLLAVDGVYPDDASIADETYPLHIRNFLYHDETNAAASEFADHVYRYLVSDEGRKLIGQSGYYFRNKK